MDMGKRLATLEVHVDYIRRDLGVMKGDLSIIGTEVGKVRVDCAVLKERVDHLPSKEWTAKLVIGVMGVGLTALVTLFATAPKLWAWMGVLPAFLGAK